MMTPRFILTALTAAVAVVLTPISSKASVLVYDGFNYGGVGDGSLTNAGSINSGDSFGWSGRWTGGNTPLTFTTYPATMGYTDINGAVMPTDAGSVGVGVLAGTTTSAQPTRGFALGSLGGGGALAANVYSGLLGLGSTEANTVGAGTGVYWASFLMQWIGPTTAGSTTNLYPRKGDIVFRSGANTNFAGQGGTELVNVGSPNGGNRIGTTIDTFSLWRGPDAGNGTLNTGLAVTTNLLSSSSWILMKFVLDTNTATADLAYMWVNWTNLLVEPDIALASATNNSGNMTGINNIRLDSNGGNAAGTNTVIGFDEFRLVTEYSDIMTPLSVPEPATVGLIGVGGLFLLTLLRRRRSGK